MLPFPGYVLMTVFYVKVTFELLTGSLLIVLIINPIKKDNGPFMHVETSCLNNSLHGSICANIIKTILEKRLLQIII